MAAVLMFRIALLFIRKILAIPGHHGDPAGACPPPEASAFGPWAPIPEAADNWDFNLLDPLSRDDAAILNSCSTFNCLPNSQTQLCDSGVLRSEILRSGSTTVGARHMKG